MVDALAATIRWQQSSFEALGVPFYAALAHELLADLARDGPVAALLMPFADAPIEAAYLLRLLGGVHRMVLRGAAPELARHFPSVGGDGDAAAAMAALTDLVRDPPADVLDALTRPPQTNEVGRCVALTAGLLTIAARVRLPLRLREIGSSGGLNLRLDSYWYEQGGHGWGDPESLVRFVDLWPGRDPPFLPGAEVVDRRGCDRDPIDVTSADGALTLLSYVWPQPAERFTRARDAIELARHRPVAVDRADAADWLAAQLADHRPGAAMVVYHSVVWQYLDEGTRDAIWSRLAAAGSAAGPDAPVAWLRLEPTPVAYVPAELRLTVWGGREAEPADRLLATTGLHGGPVPWMPSGAL